MKNVNSGQRQGLEPICVVGIKWDGFGEYFYADKDISGIRGRIIQLGEVEETITADGAGSTSNITIKLEDVDGTIKAFFDTFDLYLKPAALYQSFDGSTSNLRVPLYAGKIVGPINWDESTRTITLAITTYKTNAQVGFSYDETTVDVLHESLIGKEWPLPFGTPVHYPALALQEIPVGTTTIAFGIPDPTIPYQIAKIHLQVSDAQEEYQKKLDVLYQHEDLAQNNQMQTLFNTYWLGVYLQELNAAQKQTQPNNLAEAQALAAEYAEQSRWFKTRNVILGGYKFPQNVPIICKINEDLFICTFLGDGHLPTNPNDPCPVHIEPYFTPAIASVLAVGASDAQQSGNYSYTIISPIYPNKKKTKGITAPSVSGINNNYYANRGANNANLPRDYPVSKSGFTWVSPGSSITLLDDYNYSFLVSMLPGILITVYAYKSFNGLRKLTQVPLDYYNVIIQGNLTIVQMKRPLSIISFLINQQTARAEEFLSAVGSEYNAYVPDHVVSSTDWEDQIYVTFQSSIGPNICDIITWLVANYTPYTCDPVSFAHVKPLVANYPANFVVPGRPLVDDLLNDIVYQSRCSLILREDIYYITYLPEFPPALKTITLDDIAVDTLKISTDPIENLVTRYRATWKPDYSPDYETSNVCIVRANYIKYGYLDFEKDFYIFNQFYLVQKSALFWLIRKCQIYKIVTCELFLDNLGLEVQDTVSLDLGGFLATGPVPGIVTDTIYNSDRNTLTVTFWTPVLMGTMTDDRFAFPMTLTELDFFAPIQPITGGGQLGYSPGNIPKPVNNQGQEAGYTPAQQSVDWSGFSDPSEFSLFDQLDSNEYTNNPNNNLPGDSNDPPNDHNQANTNIPSNHSFDNTPAPTFNSNFASPKLTPPTNDIGVPTKTNINNNNTGGDTFFGQVTDGSGNTYNVSVGGISEDAEGKEKNPTVSVTVLNLSSDDNLTPGDWLSVCSEESTDKDGNTVYAYFAIVPTWMDSRTDSTGGEDE